MPSPKKAPGLAQGHRTSSVIELVPDADVQVVPDAPAGLLKKTCEVWDSFWRSDVAQAADLDADRSTLERWITYVDDWHRTHDAIKKSGLIVEGSTGQPRLSPLAGHLNTLEGSIARLEAQFGMGPKSRINLGIAVGQAQLTAAQINKMIDGDERPQIASVDGEWEEA